MQDTMTFQRTRQGVRNLDRVPRDVLPMSGGPVRRSNANVGASERLLSTVAGAALGVFGLTRGTLGGLGLAVLGGALLDRGLTGQCSLYHLLGFNSANLSGSPNAEIVYRVRPHS